MDKSTKSPKKGKKSKIKIGKSKKKVRKMRDGKVYPLLHAQTTPRPLCQAIHNLNKAQKECIVQMGFETLQHFNVDGIPSKLTYFVVDVFDPEEMVLRLPNGTIPVTIERIHELFGLPMGGQTFEAIKELKATDGDDADWTSNYRSKKITAKEIMEHMYSRSAADRLFQLDFVMLFCITMISCNQSGVCNIKLLKILKKVNNFEDLDWFGYIFNKLKTCKTGWKQGDRETPFTGPLTLLTLVYLDGTHCQGMKVSNMLTPVKLWDMAKIRLREEAELKSGRFGSVEIIKHDEKDEVVTEEEFKEMLEVMYDKLISDRDMFSQIIR